MTPAFPPRILDQLIFNTPFQLYRRGLALNSPRYNLETLGYLDERLDGMLSGMLELTPDELASQAHSLNTKVVGATGVLTFIVAHKNDTATLQTLAAQSASTGGDKRAEFLAAIQWLEKQHAAPIASSLLQSTDPAIAELGLSAHSLHHLAPGDHLLTALSHTHNGLRAAAAHHIAELGMHSLLPSLADHLRDEDPSVRFAGAATLARTRPTPDSLDVLRNFVEAAALFAEESAFLAGMSMANEDWIAWMKGLTRSPTHIPFAMRAAIGQGDIRVVPWLIHLMQQNPDLNLASGEAFSALTGVDIATAHLNIEEPKDNPANLMDDLPEPDVSKIATWWEQNQNRFPVEARWFLGKPLDLPGLHHAMLKGNQRQRVWASQKLSLIRPEKAAFPVTAPAFRQRKLLGIA